MAKQAQTGALRPDVYDAILSLRDRKEAEAFLADLCTPGELKALNERWHVARLLDEGELSYRDIAKVATASTATATATRLSRAGMQEEQLGVVRQRQQGRRTTRSGCPSSS